MTAHLHLVEVREPRWVYRAEPKPGPAECALRPLEVLAQRIKSEPTPVGVKCETVRESRNVTALRVYVPELLMDVATIATYLAPALQTLHDETRRLRAEMGAEIDALKRQLQ